MLHDGPRENLLMAGTDQQQIRHHRDAKGLLNASFLRTDLVLAQARGPSSARG